MVRTRIAPSPTGSDIHIGTIATALMNWAWAKKNSGQFIVRIEDTDRTRLVEGGEKKMLETLERIGLKADESPLVGGPYAPYRQSERLEVYKKYAEELVQKGKAYYCICKPERLDEMRKRQQAAKQIPKYDRHCLHIQEEVKAAIKNGEKFVIRLLISEKEIVFTDMVRGKIKVQGSNLDDQVLLKSDGFPTYHLGVVVDDYLMKISHVIRGEEWLPSTPKHILLYEAFDWPLPQYAHVSLLRNPDKSKLSKRKNPVWASDYLDKGILVEALLNYLALMGWSHPTGKEIFSLEEYVRVFEIKDIQKTAPIFDQVKLEWLNGQYIRQMKNEDLEVRILEFIGNTYQKDLVGKTVPLIKERIKKLSDYLPLCEFFFKAPQKYEIDLKKYEDILKQIKIKLKQVEEWRGEIIGKKMQELAKELGIKNSEFFMVVRVVITGKKISPPLNDSMEILGKEECLGRINNMFLASEGRLRP